MKTFTLGRYSRHVLDRLVDDAPAKSAVLTLEHREALGAHFRASGTGRRRRLDAWSVERGGRPSAHFRWSPGSARRALGNAALRRAVDDARLTTANAVELEVTDQLLRSAEGYTWSGSLASYLASLSPAVHGLVAAEAANWATQLAEAATSLTHPWVIAPSDAYYDVAAARTTLRGRRDLAISRDDDRVVLRVRNGAPGPSAGPGLRVDLLVDALSHGGGLAALRVIGLWPEAGMVLAVDGTMEDLRAGARDLVRASLAMRELANAA